MRWRFSILIYGSLMAWAFICLMPLAWMLSGSFKSVEDFANGPLYLPFADFQPTLANWSYIVFDSADDTLRRFGNSLVVSCLATLATVLAGGLAGFALLRAGHSQRWVLAGMIIARALPPVATALPLYLVLQNVNGLDSRWALALVYAAYNVPIAAWLLRGGFAGVSPEIFDAAVLDGASQLRVFFTMALPLAAGTVAATALFVFVLCWNEYSFALLLTTDHALTLPPFLAGQMAVREQLASAAPQWGYFSVLIVLMVAPLLLGTGVVQRLLTRNFQHATQRG